MTTTRDDIKIYQEIYPHRVPVILVAVLCLVCLCTVLYAGLVRGVLPSWSWWVAPLFMAGAALSCFVLMPRNFMLGYLLALLPFLTAWRIGAMYDAVGVMVVCSVTALVFVLQFLDCAALYMQRAEAGWDDLAQWQMTFLRIYFGYDMVGHFTEKLFAGYDSFAHMADIFATTYFVSLPPLFVVLGGLSELAIAIGIGMGFVTRLAAVFAAVYYLIATIMGSHFVHGFGWVVLNGGWEYCMLMIVFFLSFVVTGGGKFSVDGWLVRRGLVPERLSCLFIPKVAVKKPEF